MAGLLEGSLITLMVRDLEATLRFYTDTLGLECSYRAGNDWAEVRGAGTSIGLHGWHGADVGSNPERSRLSIGFKVASIEATVELLQQRGVSFPKGIQEAEVRLAGFTDPDGTPLYLYEELAA